MLVVNWLFARKVESVGYDSIEPLLLGQNDSQILWNIVGSDVKYQ
jgi:hypothetical protein